MLNEKIIDKTKKLIYWALQISQDTYCLLFI